LQMRAMLTIALAVTVLGTTSCAERSAQPTARSGVLTRDSSGVTIVHLPPGVLEPLPILSVDAPSVRIGLAEGDERHQLFEVRGVRRLPDGTFLVLNAGTHELRRYDADGRWLGSSGRRGGGPGEMQFPVFLVRAHADSSMVFDFGRRAFHIVDPEGKIAGSRSVSVTLSGFAGLLDSNTAVVATPTFPRNIYDRVLTAEVAVATVDFLQSRIDTLLILSGFQEYRYTHGELVRAVSVPFTTMPAVGVREQQIYVTNGHEPEVRVYGRDGALRQIVRFDIAAIPVSAADWERAARALIESGTGRGSGEARLTPAELTRRGAIVDAMPRPLTRPFFDRIYLEDGHNIWLRLFSLAAEEQRWIVIDSAGHPFATVVLPARIRVREINGTVVLGQEVDDLGVEYVAEYPLREAR
jgi:hypothetical protein